MGNIIAAFSMGMAFATMVPVGVEDLRTGGPWILTLIVFSVCALTCLALLLRDHRKRASVDARRQHSFVPAPQPAGSRNSPASANDDRSQQSSERLS